MNRFCLLLVCGVAFACSRTDSTVSSSYPPSMIDGDSVNQKFRTAEQFLVRGDYMNSMKAYEQVAQKHILTQEEKTYAFLNQRICEQLLDMNERLELGDTSKKMVPLRILYEGIKLSNQREDAHQLFLVAEKEFRRAGLSKGVHYLIALTQLGLYHRSYSTRVDSSIFYFKRALQLANEYDALALYRVTALFNLAELSLMFRDTMLGLSYVREAMSGSLTDEWQGRFLTLKGTMYRKLLRYDSAARYYGMAQDKLSGIGSEAALSELWREQMLSGILQNDRQILATAINNLNAIDSAKRNPRVNLNRLYGFYYHRSGQSKKAIVHYEKALKTLKQQRKYDVVQIGEAYFVLTKEYRALNDFENAKRCCYEALAYATTLRDSTISKDNGFDPRLLMQPNNFILYGLLADVYKDHFLSDNNFEHLEYALRVCDVIDSLMAEQVRVREEEAMISYLPYGHGAYSCGIEASYLLYRHTGNVGYVHKAHQFMEKSKSLIIYRDLLSRKKEYFPDVPEEFLDQEMELKSRMASLRKQPGSEEMRKTLADMDGYYALMEEKYPLYYQSKFQMSVPSFDHCQLLSERKNQSIIQYHVSEKAIYFLSYEKAPQFESVPLDSVFRNQFIKLKKILGQPPTFKNNEAATFARLSHAIYRRLFKPVGSLRRDVLIIPEGFLSQFPFEALVRDTTGSYKTLPYLIQSSTLRYAHSLKIYSMTPSGKSTPGITSMLGYAYSENSEGDGNVSLPGSTSDLKSLAASFPESSLTIRSGDGASKSQFLDDLQESYSLIHVAMHASSSVSERDNNKIEFGASDVESRYLYAHELIPRKLKAHTVVLASCESASGMDVQGEGTFNLERAFTQMGASTVVSSVWQMPDRLGSELIGHFYSQLKRTPRDVPGSLSRSKLDYLQNADEYTAHPYFWAALLCIENQRGGF